MLYGPVNGEVRLEMLKWVQTGGLQQYVCNIQSLQHKLIILLTEIQSDPIKAPRHPMMIPVSGNKSKFKSECLEFNLTLRLLRLNGQSLLGILEKGFRLTLWRTPLEHIIQEADVLNVTTLLLA